MTADCAAKLRGLIFLMPIAVIVIALTACAPTPQPCAQWQPVPGDNSELPQRAAYASGWACGYRQRGGQ